MSRCLEPFPGAMGRGSHSSAWAGVYYFSLYCAEPPLFPACPSPGAEGSSVVFLCSDMACCLLPSTLLSFRHDLWAKKRRSLLLPALETNSHQVSAWRGTGLG